jgi:hypothetical protein
MSKIHSLQNSLAINPNQDLTTILALLDTVLDEYESLDLVTKRSNVRNVLFCIFQIINNKDADQKLLENLAKITKNLKPYTYESEYYSKVNANLYKKMFMLSGENKRNILFKNNYKIEVETGLVLITSLETNQFENLDDSFLTSLSNKLIVIETGGDGLINLKVELINMNYPFLSLTDYKREIFNNSDLLTLDFDAQIYINDGAEQNPKNVITLDPGRYDCVWYEFYTEYKLVIVKSKN